MTVEAPRDVGIPGPGVDPGNAATSPLGGHRATDTQVGGNHYRKLGDYQPMSVLAYWLTPEELRGFAKGAAIKYLCRERDKGCDEDIRKAIHILQLYLQIEGNNQ